MLTDIPISLPVLHTKYHTIKTVLHCAFFHLRKIPWGLLHTSMYTAYPFFFSWLQRPSYVCTTVYSTNPLPTDICATSSLLLL